MFLFSTSRDVWRRRAEAFSDSRWGPALLAPIAFADSSILPVLPDLLLVPMLLIRPERSLFLCTVCVLSIIDGWSDSDCSPRSALASPGSSAE